ncbi:lipoyl(octanoyl) transferase LipB [Thiohalorhabdus methylotrophus]|uniref:Octanoyltransferase n=1 Tax=Thiohalorhabdus methylotrophus TaxID=3242694 RepID=A0ABV4TXR8_9GAMM
MPISSPIPTSSPPSETEGSPRVHELGLRDYSSVWAAMQAFTAERDAATPDELWLVEHPPVFTQGRNGKPEHLLHVTGIPVVETDRGGQVTYHGPGQCVAYPLLDLRRRGWGIRTYVAALEQAVIDFLAGFGLAGTRREGAPGIYLDRPGQPKIASIGLRVRGGCTYHGVSLNLTNDLGPFAMINPCGYAGMAVTRLADHVPDLDADAARQAFTAALQHTFRLSQEPLHG